MNRLCHSLFAVLLMFLAVAGCDRGSQSVSKPFGTSEVEGLVTMDGEPVEHARVVFVPMGLDGVGEVLPMAFAETDAEGKFQLKTGANETRLQAGDYRVLITKLPRLLMRTEEDESLESDASYAQFDASGNQIPLIYNRYSELKFTVTNSYEPLQAELKLTSICPLLSSTEDLKSQEH